MQTKMNLENFIIRLFNKSVFSNFDIKLPETISIVRYLDAVADRVFHIARTYELLMSVRSLGVVSISSQRSRNYP